MDNTAAQLTAKDFKVTITRDGQDVEPDANGKYDLSKPGIYTVTYSRDFNGTTISNSGQITVTSVKEPDKPSGNNKGGNNSGVIVPVNPSDNNSNTAPTDNDTDTSKPTDNNTDTSKPTDNKKPTRTNRTDDISSKANVMNMTKRTTKSGTISPKANVMNMTKRTTKSGTISPKANVMNITKRTTKSGTISPKAVALANTTAGPATSAKANMENGIAKNNSQNSQTLPQTGENESKVAFTVAGLLAAGIGLFALAIDRKRSK